LIVEIRLTCSSAAGLEGDRDTNKQRASHLELPPPLILQQLVCLCTMSTSNTNSSHSEQQLSATVCTTDCYKANPASGLCSCSPTVTHETFRPSILENLPTSRASTRSRVRDPVSDRSCTARGTKPYYRGQQRSTCRLQAAAQGRAWSTQTQTQTQATRRRVTTRESTADWLTKLCAARRRACFGFLRGGL
jgi:hypothetical protein